ncbi:MAG: hypothetical protein ACR2GP_10895 [Burkholderiaceae bacterium]
MRAPRRTERRTARPYVIPERLCDALAQIFKVQRETIARIVVIEYSRFARLHGRHVAATTRRNAIYLLASGDAFVGDIELVLHEYFHVLRQWNRGTLTVWRYLRESLRRGYTANRYEVEARAFALERRNLRLPGTGKNPIDHRVI